MSDLTFPGFGNSVNNPFIPEGLNPFQSIPGLSISVTKEPSFDTSIYRSSSGVEYRHSQMTRPIWDIEIGYNFLNDWPGANSPLKDVMGFFLLMSGSYDTFLFKDPDDYRVTRSVCGEADNSTTQFYFNREMGGFLEPVGKVDQDNMIKVYLENVLVDPEDYTIVGNRVVFDGAPSSGTITAEFQFFYVCRFKDSSLEFDKFAEQLWELRSCSIRSVLT